MTAVAQRTGVSRSLLVCLALASVGVGVLSGVNPQYGIIAALGVTFAAVVMRDLTMGFVLFTALSFLDLASSSGSFSGTKVLGLILSVSWLARLATSRGRELAGLITENKAIVISLLAMLGWCTLSFAWAESPSTALGGAGRYALDMLLIPIAFAAIRERRHLVWVLAAFVVGAVFSVLYGTVHPVAPSGFGGRQSGAFGDPNAEGTVLAAAIPLLIMVGVIRQSARMKLLVLIGVAIMFLGLVESLSREALVSFGAVMVVAVIFGGRWRKRAAALLLIGVVATGGYYFVFAPLASRQRVTSADTSGRSSLWTVAWRVIEAHPVLGVGTDNFILVEGHYVNRPGPIAALYIVDQPKVTHNAYLEALTDLGIPGLLTFVAVLGFSVAAAVRATRIFERLGDREMELASRAVILALTAVITDDFFVSSEYAKFLWIPLALCPVLLALARREQARARVAPLRSARLPPAH